MSVPGKKDQTPDRYIAQVTIVSSRREMENVTYRYHMVSTWVAMIFDPLFAVTDYFNIPGSWKVLLGIRIMVSLITFTNMMVVKKYKLPSFFMVVVPFMLISLQNAYTYDLIGNSDLLGHNLNYMALLIGASMFAMWTWRLSVGMLFISALATIFFFSMNPRVTMLQFFVNGGLLLCVSGVFMVILIKTRYDLTLKEIRSRLALQLSNEEIQVQNTALQVQEDIIKGINGNLESLVRDRTIELERKNKALEEYAFINAHNLRGPLASILGLINLMGKQELNEESRSLLDHLNLSADKLDDVVRSITRAIEKSDG